MHPYQLSNYLSTLIDHSVHHSVMIWGPPGIGKSSVVAQLARSRKMGFIDLRLSQLAPTDLRGVPVPIEGITHWYPPEFLPRTGTGILFLDEINLAPPALQGVAQQLVLDRRVGSYEVPKGWFVWAAGNRKEDRAAIFDMPAPLANRFLHLRVEPHLESFRQYAIAQKMHEQIIGFLNFRPSLLHKPDANSEAWPSPRSWEMADALLKLSLDLAPAIGIGVAAEFNVFSQSAAQIPLVEAILNGKSKEAFPAEPSIQYALSSALVIRINTVAQAINAFRWLSEKAPPEWVQMVAADLFPKLRNNKLYEAFRREVQADEDLMKFLGAFSALAS